MNREYDNVIGGLTVNAADGLEAHLLNQIMIREKVRYNSSKLSRRHENRYLPMRIETDTRDKKSTSDLRIDNFLQHFSYHLVSGSELPVTATHVQDKLRPESAPAENTREWILLDTPGAAKVTLGKKKCHIRLWPVSSPCNRAHHLS